MRLILICLAFLLPASSLFAQGGTVPAGLLVKIVMAAVAYDRSIEERFGDVVHIAVVGDSARAGELRGVLDGYADKKLKGRSIKVSTIDFGSLEQSDANLVFFADPLGAEAKKWAAVCARMQATGVSADEQGVIDGLPLGLELTAAGKPKLLINLQAAKDAGANFSAQVLKLARIVE